MFLPYSVQPATQWQVWDYGVRQVRSPAAAGGIAEAKLPAVPDNELWFIDRAVVQLDPDAGGLALLYVDIADADHLIDASYIGALDVADFAAPHLIKPAEQLLCQWTDAADGAIGRLRVQYTVMRRTELKLP